jgi:hypothetical protein
VADLLPTFVLDTSPLTALCRFPLNDLPYIHLILSYADIVLPSGVIAEAKGGSGIIARIVFPLLK